MRRGRLVVAALAVAGCVAFNSYQVKKARTAEGCRGIQHGQGCAAGHANPCVLHLDAHTGRRDPRGQKLDASVELTVVPTKTVRRS